MTDERVFKKICSLLDGAGVEYVVKRHAPTPTSEESAKARGEPIKIGAKALFLKSKKGFCLAVIPANRRLDTKKVKKLLGSKSLRFANDVEREELLGLPKGAIPPFGFLLGQEKEEGIEASGGAFMLVDRALFEEEKVAFNAGSLKISVLMKSVDYRKVISGRKNVVEGEFSSL